jgi:hypothetical protein
LYLLGAVLVVPNLITCNEAVPEPLVKVCVIRVCNDVKTPGAPPGTPPPGKVELPE